MYPAAALTRLAERKARLRADLARDRLRWAASARPLARALDRVDRGRRVLAGLAALLALGALAAGGRRPRSWAARLLAWAPVALRGYRAVRAFAAGLRRPRGPASPRALTCGGRAR